MRKFMIVVLSAVVLSGFTPVIANAAESVAIKRPNVISFEGLGRAFLYSLNYDRSVIDRVSVGGGFSFFGLSGANIIVVPIYGNYYFHPGKHRAFVTGGLDIIRVSVTVGSLSLAGSGVAGTVGGGYEYRGESGFLFRAAPYLLFPLGTGGSVLPYIGLSAGYAF